MRMQLFQVLLLSAAKAEQQMLFSQPKICVCSPASKQALTDQLAADADQRQAEGECPALDKAGLLRSSLLLPLS